MLLLQSRLEGNSALSLPLRWSLRRRQQPWPCGTINLGPVSPLLWPGRMGTLVLLCQTPEMTGCHIPSPTHTHPPPAGCPMGPWCRRGFCRLPLGWHAGIPWRGATLELYLPLYFPMEPLGD